MKKKLYSIIITLALVLSMMPASVFAENPANVICILATSDVHCAYSDYDKLATYRNQMKIEYGADNVALIDAGDCLQGDYAGYYDQGESMTSVISSVGYDVMVPGNHDFDYTADRYFDNLIGKLGSTIVSCNIYKNGEAKLNPYIVKELGDVKVAFVGITTPSTLTESNPKNFVDGDGKTVYDFCNDNTGAKLYARVQESVTEARKEADYVIAIGHIGDKGGDDYAWKSSNIIANTTGIDAFIDGHAHQTFSKTVKNKEKTEVPVIATGTKLANIGKIIIGTDGRIATENVATTGITAENVDAVKTAIEELNNKVKAAKDIVIGNSLVDLTIYTEQNGGKDRIVRKMECNAGDFVADAYRTVTGADIGLANGGGVRADVNRGAITFGNIFELNPFGNELCVCNVKGQSIVDALEHSVRTAPDVEQGGFLQVSGLEFKIDPSIKSTVVVEGAETFVRVAGERRVYDIKVNGRAIDPNGYYTVASTTYILMDGGNGYTMFNGSKVLKEEVMLDNEALIQYVQDNLNGTIGTEYAKPAGRIVFEKKPVVDPEKKDNPTSEEEVENVAKTGDNSLVVFYLTIASLSILGIGYMLIRRRQSKMYR